MNILRIAQRFDTRGLSCPMPLAKTAQAMSTLSWGHLLEVIAYHLRSVTDFEAWSKSTESPLVGSSVEGGVYRVVLRREGRSPRLSTR